MNSPGGEGSLSAGNAVNDQWRQRRSCLCGVLLASADLRFGCLSRIGIGTGREDCARGLNCLPLAATNLPRRPSLLVQ
jgi:hypothetical protein